MWDSIDGAFAKLKQSSKSPWAGYAGFYSSWYGGYFKEPWAMLVPMDDHGFHRGDGVFEAVKIHGHAYFDLQSHLRRLLNSAERIGIAPYGSVEEIQKIVLELAKRCNLDMGILRLYMTRGPGGFSPSPEECTGTQLYAAITVLKPADLSRYRNGVKCMISKTVAKDPFYTGIKSLNYLQNVLMRRECRDGGFDFGVCVDPSGRVCEGATENLLIVNKDMELIVPRFDYTLRGTTVSLVMKIAEEKAGALGLKAVRHGDLTIKDLKTAKELAFVGTTLGVLPVSSLDKEPVGEGRGGPVALTLNDELMKKMALDPAVRTEF
jgi:branched-chain amino acid aminotransferase